MRARMTAAKERPGWVGGQLLRVENHPSRRVIVGAWRTRADWEAWHRDAICGDASSARSPRRWSEHRRWSEGGVDARGGEAERRGGPAAPPPRAPDFRGQPARFLARPAPCLSLSFTDRRETALAAASVSLSFFDLSAREPSVTMPASSLSSSITGRRPTWARAMASIA